MFVVRQTEEFVAWLGSMTCRTSVRKSVSPLARVMPKRAISVTGSLSKARCPGCAFTLAPAIACSLHFVRRGRVLVVMLNGGDKATQKGDFRRALKIASEVGEDL